VISTNTPSIPPIDAKGALAAALFVWPLIGNALLNFCQRTIVLRYCDEAISQAGIRCRVR
jgi:hypothetical protein